MRIRLMAAAGLALAWGQTTLAQEAIVYPAKGQSVAQQDTDRGECQVWATKNTGINPMALAQKPAAQAQQPAPSGERARGALRGAIGGAAIGSIAGDTGKGAAIGATGGVMMGGREASKKQVAQQQAAESQRQTEMQNWNRAFGACMEGRGYTVK